jgi:hypothetical protein
MSAHFSIPTSNTSKIIKEAKRLTNKLFLPGYEYQKIGVMLLNISDAKNEQGSLLDSENYSKSDTVMTVSRCGEQAVWIRCIDAWSTGDTEELENESR